MRVCRALLLLAMLASVGARAETVLKVAPITDVQLLDPVFSTAWVNVVAGSMIYETLFAPDSKLQPKPQMVDHWTHLAGRADLDLRAARRAALP